MTKFTGKLTFDNLQKYASDNGFSTRYGHPKGYVVVDSKNSVDAWYSTLKEAFRFIANSIEYNNINKLQTESVPLLIDTNPTLEIIECKDVVDALKTAKSVVSFNKADKHTQKLFIATNNDKFLAIGSNGSEYAIAVCELPTTESFYAVIPLEKSNGKEIGFCPFMQVLSKQKKINDFTYQLDTTNSDEIKLIAKCNGSEFSFNTLPNDFFNITSELQVIIDDFLGDSQGCQVVDSYGIEQSQSENNDNQLTDTYGNVVNKKSINHICFDDSDEYFILNDYVYKSHRSNTIDLDTNYRCGATAYGSPESILSYNEFSINRDTIHGYPSELINYLKDNYDVKQDNQDNNLITEIETIETSNIELETMNKQVEDNNIEIENTITEVTQDSNTKYVVGVGDIELISVDKIQTGMYLSYSGILYTVQSIETVNFINASSQTIITVRNLINASIEQKILVSSDELLPAWFTSYKKSEVENEVREVKTEVTKVAKREIKPIVTQEENIELLKPKIPSKSDAGIKGEGREKLLKMVKSGCTLQDMMTEFNWSEKNAQNHVTYIKWWGYNLKRENKVYKLM
ncbi:MAG: hypothetical protein ACRC2S_16360 [Waterburya sp.]